MSPRFRFTDWDGETSSRKEFITTWIRSDIKSKDTIVGKIIVYNIQPQGKKVRAVVDDGYWKFHDHWQQTGGIWKLAKRDMYGPSAAQERQMRTNSPDK